MLLMNYGSAHRLRSMNSVNCMKPRLRRWGTLAGMVVSTTPHVHSFGAMIQVVKPTIGETVYDSACGSCGFLCEAYDFMQSEKGLSTKDAKRLQEKTFYGKEKKSLAYVIGIMNMILHGIEAPNIIHTNTLSENLADIQQKDRHDIILANPPFGGGERKESPAEF